MRQLGEPCLHIGTHLGGMVCVVTAHKRGERRGTRRDGQAAAAEGRTMVAGLKDVSDFFLCHHGTHGHAVGDALGKTHDIGLHTISLERKRLAGAENTTLDLVGDKHGTHLVCQVARRSHKLLGHGMHTAFALDRLEHHSANLASQLLKDCVQFIYIVGCACHKATRQRAETVLQPILHGRGNGLERTTMKSAAHTHDGVATVAGTFGVQTRELHRALVGLGTGIGKERLPHLLARSRSAKRRRRGLVASGNRVGKHARTVRIVVGELGQQRRDLAALLNVEVVGDMQELLGLGLERREHRRVAVA